MFAVFILLKWLWFSNWKSARKFSSISIVLFVDRSIFVILLLGKLKNQRLISFDSKRKTKRKLFQMLTSGCRITTFHLYFSQSMFKTSLWLNELSFYICALLFFYVAKKLLFGLHYYFIVLGKKKKQGIKE